MTLPVTVSGAAVPAFFHGKRARLIAFTVMEFRPENTIVRIWNIFVYLNVVWNFYAYYRVTPSNTLASK